MKKAILLSVLVLFLLCKSEYEDNQVYAKEIETDNKEHQTSSRSEQKSDHVDYSYTSNNYESYDSGYDDVYYNDGDYDDERYEYDYEYAEGVDDAYEDCEDEDWYDEW